MNKQSIEVYCFLCKERKTINHVGHNFPLNCKKCNDNTVMPLDSEYSIDGQCDICKNLCGDLTISVHKKDLHLELQEDHNLIDKEEAVSLCENCRAMDAKMKLGTDNFGMDIIMQVKSGLYIKH